MPFVLSADGIPPKYILKLLQLNGHVERINGTWRTDFYELYDLPTQLAELRPLLHDCMDT